MNYCMQTGTGSVGLLPGITYTYNNSKWARGFELIGDIKLNKNSRNYRCGSSVKFSPWVAYSVLPVLSVTVRGEYIATTTMCGRDRDFSDMYLDQVLVSDPLFYTRNYGSDIATLFGGANLHPFKRGLKNLNLNMEFGMPVYQCLNGVQTAMQATFAGGVNYRF